MTDVRRARSCAVIVPSAAAADQLRRTIENHRLLGRSSTDRALVSAADSDQIGMVRRDARAARDRRRGGSADLEREVLLNAAAREVAASEVEPPFRLRAGLLVEMLGLYDDLRRRDSSVDTSSACSCASFERDADDDRGAARLLKQTRFLAATFRGYEARRDATGAVDEYALRARLLDAESSQPLRQIVVTVGERSVDAAGLWPADLALSDAAPSPRTHRHRRHASDDRRWTAGAAREVHARVRRRGAAATTRTRSWTHSSRPVLIAHAETQPYTVSRDREDELSSIAAAVKTAGPDDLERRAVVFKRPLPYVYLARDVFADAGVPYQTFDALPLAAEPYAAALDLVFEFVTSNFTREPVVALLGSPHFSFEADGAAIRRSDVAGTQPRAQRRRLFRRPRQPDARSNDGRPRRQPSRLPPSLRRSPKPNAPSVQLDALLAFLNAHDRVPDVGDPLRERHLRARRAVLSAIHGLRRAHQHLDDSPVELSNVAAMIRRWIEGQTFSPRAGHTGVQLLDAQAARYGEFDEVFLVGLVEGEWPQRSSKSIFYPASLLSQLDWPDSRMALAGERAAFHDLMALARRHVHLSTFELENDAIVGPSVFLEDADRLGFRTEVLPARQPRPPVRVRSARARSGRAVGRRGRRIGVARSPNRAFRRRGRSISRRGRVVSSRQRTASARSSGTFSARSDSFRSVSSACRRIPKTKPRSTRKSSGFSSTKCSRSSSKNGTARDISASRRRISPQARAGFRRT